MSTLLELPMYSRLRQIHSLTLSSTGLVFTVVLIAIAVRLNSAILPLIAIGLLVFTPLERIKPRRKQQLVSKATLISLAHVTVTTTLTTALMSGVIGLVAVVPVVPVTAEWIASLHPALALLVVVIVGDTGYYWAHRAAHGVPLLWRFHRIHHASEELNWMAAARAHPLDQLILHLGWLLPLRLLGANAAWFAIYAIFLTVEPLIAHSNINIKLKPLKWLIVTPEFHHWHHTAEPDAINKNFASQLPVLDLVFGTWWLPKNRRVSRYGIDDPINDSYFGQILAPGADALSWMRHSIGAARGVNRTRRRRAAILPQPNLPDRRLP